MKSCTRLYLSYIAGVLLQGLVSDSSDKMACSLDETDDTEAADTDADVMPDGDDVTARNLLKRQSVTPARRN